jgi:hypothetical protein
MPGILNEAGWNAWSYHVEGLQTFEGDGSRWAWRDVSADVWPAASRLSVAAAGFVSLVSVAGLVVALSATIDTFIEASIAAGSAVTYALSGVGYYLNARRLRGAAWCAPLWFVPYIPALILTFRNVRRPVGEEIEHSEFIHID